MVGGDVGLTPMTGCCKCDKAVGTHPPTVTLLN